jgi:serine/threonine-protein kinase
MSRADAQPDDLTHGEWAEPPPADAPRAVQPDRSISSGCRSDLAAETCQLLRERLRAASLMLAVAFTLLLLRNLWFNRTPHRLALLHGALVLLLAGNLWLLRGRWKPTLRQLRALELATFGAILAALIAGQSLGLQARIAMGLLDQTELRIQFKNSIIGTLLVILTYAVFIPNTWRRSVGIILLMTIAPLVAPLALGLTDEGFRQAAREAWTVERLSENGLFLALGAGIAIFGTYSINGCRDDEFRARWLNQYRLGEKLGAGGMGEVYLARHEMLRRPCAIKLIRPGLSAKSRVLARFEREAQATARLSHWNTVDVYDYGRDEDGTFYYVMEYLPGLNLQTLVDRHGPLPPGRVIYLLRQACDALREAHEAGFVHRDLKPPNIFAAYRGARYDVAKLLDFGLVKDTRDEESPSLTREGMVTGSPLYMAPEQVMRSRPPDPRTDLYALGAIAYFLLTGRPPFTGADSMAVMVSQARDPVVPPSTLREDVPDDLEAVLLRCLEKEPDDRYPDAQTLALALADCGDADGWSAEEARAWWQAHEPRLVAELTAGEATEPDRSDSLPIDDDDRVLTLGGDEVEAVESIDAAEARPVPPPGAKPGSLDSPP